MRTFIHCLIGVYLLSATADNQAHAQAQASAQQPLVGQPPPPAKNPPVVQLSTPSQPAQIQYVLQAMPSVPPPQTPPVVQMLYQQPAVQTVQYVQQPVQAVQTVQYVQQPAVQTVQYVQQPMVQAYAQQPTVLAGLPGCNRTIVLSPGPLRLAGAYLGRQMVGLGKTHVIQLGVSSVVPVQPSVVQPSYVQPTQPTVYVATTAGPVQAQPPVQMPGPQTYQLVPVQAPPNPLREAAPPPPTVPTPQAATTTTPTTTHPLFRSLFGQ